MRLTPKRITVTITPAEIELVREWARSHIESFRYRGAPAHKQPTEWHEGQTVLKLGVRLAAAYRRGRVPPRAAE